MTKILLKWAVLTGAVVLAAFATQALGQPFSVKTDQIVQLFLGSAVLAFVNATLGKVLKFVTAPVNCLTLGLFSLIINAALLFMVGSWGFGFTVGNFLAAFVGSIFISIINAILGGILIKDKERDED